MCVQKRAWNAGHREICTTATQSNTERLLSAVQRRDTASIQRLLVSILGREASSIRTQLAQGQSPLMILCSRIFFTPGLERAIEPLLEAGADTNVQCRRSGFCALHFTVTTSTDAPVHGL